MIADVDANIGQISGDFGEEVRLFERCERRVGLQPLSNRDSAGMHNLHAGAAIYHLGWLRWRWRCSQLPLGDNARRAEADEHPSKTLMLVRIEKFIVFRL